MGSGWEGTLKGHDSSPNEVIRAYPVAVVICRVSLDTLLAWTFPLGRPELAGPSCKPKEQRGFVALKGELILGFCYT